MKLCDTSRLFLKIRFERFGALNLFHYVNTDLLCIMLLQYMTKALVSKPMIYVFQTGLWRFDYFTNSFLSVCAAHNNHRPKNQVLLLHRALVGGASPARAGACMTLKQNIEEPRKCDLFAWFSRSWFNYLLTEWSTQHVWRSLRNIHEQWA